MTGLPSADKLSHFFGMLAEVASGIPKGTLVWNIRKHIKTSAAGSPSYVGLWLNFQMWHRDISFRFYRHVRFSPADFRRQHHTPPFLSMTVVVSATIAFSLAMSKFNSGSERSHC